MRVCIMGMGYIGLPTAIVAAHSGMEVVGVDVNPSIVERTNSGELHILEPGLREMLRQAVACGSLRAYATPMESDVFLIVVPTPFKGNHEPDISYVSAAVTAVAPCLRAGNLLIIESTSPVGTTENMARILHTLRPDLADSLRVAYCPERVLPGNVVHELVNNDRVVGGLTPAATEAAKAFYGQFVKGSLHGTDARTAEMCKLVENASRDVQIAFANELSIICSTAGIDVWELIALANKHPRVNILKPGCGVGGHCIAVDPYFITADFPSQSKLIALGREINNYKALWCVQKIKNAMLDFEKSFHRTPIVALMGLAFKPDIDDLRQSPALYIASSLVAEHGADRFLIVEPYITSHPLFTLTPYMEAYQKADIVVFLTAHKPFRELPVTPGKVTLDFCGIYR